MGCWIDSCRFDLASCSLASTLTLHLLTSCSLALSHHTLTLSHPALSLLAHPLPFTALPCVLRALSPRALTLTLASRSFTSHSLALSHLMLIVRRHPIRCKKEHMPPPRNMSSRVRLPARVGRLLVGAPTRAHKFEGTYGNRSLVIQILVSSGGHLQWMSSFYFLCSLLFTGQL